MVAAMVMGWEVLQTSGYDLTVVIAALAVHYILGITFAMMLAAIIAPFQLDSSMGLVALTGAAFGVLLYVLNFYGMSGAFTGACCAVFYRMLERPEKRE
jgi:hypothetical protein